GYDNKTGIGNTFIGENAGYDNTTGSNNTYLGREAGDDNNGSNNTYIGRGAGGGFFGSVSNNVFLGYQAGFNESGSNRLYIANSNTANPLIYGEFDNNLLRINGTLQIGNTYAFPTTDGTSGQVLQTNGSGSLIWTTPAAASTPTLISDTDNDTRIQVENNGNDQDSIQLFLVGTERATLSTNTSGPAKLSFPNNNGNVIIGDQAGTATTTGVANTFLGFLAGSKTTTAERNTFVGGGAGRDNTTGQLNTYIGVDAGRDNTTGNNNTYLGLNAGLQNNGSGNVFIGYLAGSQATAASNRLYIDNSNTTTPLIYGEFDNNRVGINRVATTNTLEVNGEASKATAGDWLANSDARLKKNIQSLSSEQMLEKLLQLQGITYEWNDTLTGYPRPIGTQYGFTAQNVQDIFPTLVKEDAQGYLQTAYGTYDAMYVEAIRALVERNQRLENNQQKLTAENEALKRRLDRIEAMLTTPATNVSAETEK
ncbi:MAG: tail fiber domain-containing protein, partial [Bacteroidota bacterium]